MTRRKRQKKTPDKVTAQAVARAGESEDIPPVTVQERLETYQRRIDSTVTVGAAYAGLALLLTASLLSDAPALIENVVATVIILGAGALGWARSQYKWEYALLETRARRRIKAEKRKHDDDDDDEHRGRGSDVAYDVPLAADLNRKDPRIAKALYLVAIFLAIIGSVVLLVGIWWP